MLRILRSEIKQTNGNEKYVVADIAVSSADELTTEYNEYHFLDTSICWVISTGEFYGLADGTWYKQGNNS